MDFYTTFFVLEKGVNMNIVTEIIEERKSISNIKLIIIIYTSILSFQGEF